METWISPDRTAGLGHTRLAIIDLKTGQQPMAVLCGRFVGAFNGEIYNFRELRSELEELGHNFYTKSDTEVLLVAFGQWGEHCLHRLDGMFAFAIYDTVDRKLFLARDRVGIKPLYYHRGIEGLVFGSELKAVLAWPHVPRRSHLPALADDLVLGYPVPPATCFQDCFELEPGTLLEISTRGLRKQRYWTWIREESDWNESRALELLEQELTEAVQEQQVADVPVGAFLSGGIDSSLLVALLARSKATQLKTFTVKFAEEDYDESACARVVARHVGSEHHELLVEKTKDGLALVGKVLDQFDQPFGDSSAIPTYLLSREIRRHVKVAMGGDGGDEMFGGYNRFLYADAARLLNKVPRSLLRITRSCLKQGGSVWLERRRQFARLIDATAQNGAERLTSICSQVPMGQFRKSSRQTSSRCWATIEPP